MKTLASGVLVFFGLLGTVLAQDESLGQKIDELTYAWDSKSPDLMEYENLSKFCLSDEYRTDFITLLQDLHHYDSVLLERLSKAARFSHDREIEKTLREIETFESEYSIRDFIHFLREECDRRKSIEHEADDLKKDIGTNSYDGQIYLIETELHNFIKNTTKRVDHIRKHVHHLHIN